MLYIFCTLLHVANHSTTLYIQCTHVQLLSLTPLDKFWKDIFTERCRGAVQVSHDTVSTHTQRLKTLHAT
jgi:hypothetical protein